MFCIKCGTEVKDTDKFCYKCGSPIASIITAPQKSKAATRFETDEKYRDKIIEKIHKQQDKEYEKRIKKLNSQLAQLTNQRNAAIEYVQARRWENAILSNIRVNNTEGLLSLNGQNYPFTSIKGAEVFMISGARIMMNQVENKESNKSVSVLGGLAGAVIAGPVGALVGGVALGKKNDNTATKQQTNSIPTCVHLGVKVNLNGFVSEITLISSEVDQTDQYFRSQYQNAQNIVALLGRLAATPMPTYIPPVLEDSSVLSIDDNINNVKYQIEQAIADVPTYEIPDKYMY